MPQRASSSTNAAIRSWLSSPGPCANRAAIAAPGRPDRLAALPTVVLLHGFAATPRHWDRGSRQLPPGRFTPLALNLTDAAPPSADGVSALVARAPIEHFVLAGYSMGGRLALHTALAIPARVTRLVLISASAGIDDDGERAARRAADESLAA